MPRQVHQARRLFKATRTNAPERLPSVRSRSRDPAGKVAFVVHSRFLAPHPVARLEPCLPRQRPVGRFELSHPARLVTGCPAPRRAGEKDASLRLLQPTHDTSTLYAARFPLSLPSCLTAFRPRGPPAHDEPSMTRPTQACALADTSSDESTGGASLDGEPPASALPQPAKQLPGAGALDRRLLRASHGLVGASIERSSALCFPNVALSATRRACSSASDALCRDDLASPGLSVGSALATTRLLLRRRLVKDSNFIETKAPSIDGVASFTHRVHVRTSPTRAGELDQQAARGRAPITTSPVDFCNQISLRAQPRTLRAPVETADVAHPARAGLGGDLRTGLGPRPPRRLLIRVASRLPPAHEPHGPNEGFHLTPAELSRTRGRPASRRSVSPSMTPGGVACASLAYARSREHFPGSIHSCTSCRETGAMSAGEPDTTDHVSSRSWIVTKQSHRANPRPANRERPTCPGSASPRTTSSR